MPKKFKTKQSKDVQKNTRMVSKCDIISSSNVACSRVIKNTFEFMDNKFRGVMDEDGKREFENLTNKYQSFMSIPRRPANATSMTKSELLATETFNFDIWRQNLAKLKDCNQVTTTPYESKLEFWRQLWRVVERSDVLLQVVDARNPLLFRNQDLEKYVKEVGQTKINIILINKADFLTKKQMELWAKFFNEQGLKVMFYSAKIAMENLKMKLANPVINVELRSEVKEVDSLPISECDSEVIEERAEGPEVEATSVKILSAYELMGMLEKIQVQQPQVVGKVMVGFIGYPNVGKSNTINSIYGSKKLSVSATPGRTKHFQTLHISKKLTFCDCPGLVMPSLAYNAAEIAISGVIPIDTMSDFTPSVNLIASQFPIITFNVLYGTRFEFDCATRHPTGHELQTAYWSAHNNSNLNQVSRQILKDYFNGKLLYCVPPPGITATEFQSAAPITGSKMDKYLKRKQKQEEMANKPKQTKKRKRERAYCA